MRTKPKLRVPHPWIRRLVITPVVFVVVAAMTVTSPLWHLIFLFLDIFDRRAHRFTRIGGLAIAMCVTEFLGLLAALFLWIGSGFGLAINKPLFQRAHNKVFGWWLELVTRALRVYLGFEFVMPVGETITGPVLTFARHAGPGDAFLLARTVIQDYGRQLRMLGTNRLLWDPFMNHMLTRLPFHFCDTEPTDPTADLEAIAEMCGSMQHDSVMIIFPEGGNWTPTRWDRAIGRLEERGKQDLAEKAAAMPHVLPPRTQGAIAALRARRDVTVVFVGHVGLEDLYSLKQIWVNVPLGRRVQAAYWSVPAEEIPDEPKAISSWLFDQWGQVESWIVAHEAAISEPD